MRKLFLLPAVLLCIVGVFQSCSKQAPGNMVAPVRTNLVNATIAPNGNYQLSIENSGVISISKQASHFQVSQTEPDTKSGFTLYKYIPAADYRGTDEVVLSNTKTILSNGNGRCSNNSNNHTSNSDITSITSYTTIKIKITD